MQNHANRCSCDPKYRARTNAAETFMLATMALAWFADTYLTLNWFYNMPLNHNVLSRLKDKDVLSSPELTEEDTFRPQK